MTQKVETIIDKEEKETAKPKLKITEKIIKLEPEAAETTIKTTEKKKKKHVDRALIN